MKTYTMKGSPDASSFTHSDESRNPVIIMNDYSVYIMVSKRNGTQYVGFTGDLVQMVYAHKHDLVEGFTK
ncbi:MAG: hypothetical protein Q8P44_02130 [Dehalococcoidia bacterium]|nr:hypothetical protein [Dehalococcoidia bacterium]